MEKKKKGKKGIVIFIIIVVLFMILLGKIYQKFIAEDEEPEMNYVVYQNGEWVNVDEYELVTDDLPFDFAEEYAKYEEEFKNQASDIEGMSVWDKLTAGLSYEDGSDSDGDGLTDKEEIEIYHSDPLLASTANDMFSDSEKIAMDLDPHEAVEGVKVDIDDKISVIPAVYSDRNAIIREAADKHSIQGANVLKEYEIADFSGDIILNVSDVPVSNNNLKVYISKQARRPSAEMLENSFLDDSNDVSLYALLDIQAVPYTRDGGLITFNLKDEEGNIEEDLYYAVMICDNNNSDDVHLFNDVPELIDTMGVRVKGFGVSEKENEKKGIVATDDEINDALVWGFFPVVHLLMHTPLNVEKTEKYGLESIEANMRYEMWDNLDFYGKYYAVTSGKNIQLKYKILKFLLPTFECPADPAEQPLPTIFFTYYLDSNVTAGRLGATFDADITDNLSYNKYSVNSNIKRSAELTNGSYEFNSQRAFCQTEIYNDSSVGFNLIENTLPFKNFGVKDITTGVCAGFSNLTAEVFNSGHAKVADEVSVSDGKTEYTCPYNINKTPDVSSKLATFLNSGIGDYGGENYIEKLGAVNNEVRLIGDKLEYDEADFEFLKMMTCKWAKNQELGFDSFKMKYLSDGHASVIFDPDKGYPANVILGVMKKLNKGEIVSFGYYADGIISHAVNIVGMKKVFGDRSEFENAEAATGTYEFLIYDNNLPTPCYTYYVVDDEKEFLAHEYTEPYNMTFTVTIKRINGRLRVTSWDYTPLDPDNGKTINGLSAKNGYVYGFRSEDAIGKKVFMHASDGDFNGILWTEDEFLEEYPNEFKEAYRKALNKALIEAIEKTNEERQKEQKEREESKKKLLETLKNYNNR